MTDDMPVSPLHQDNYAFFFDLDGTLAEIKPTPEQVVIPSSVLHTLHALAEYSNGALALVSGRAVSELDNLLAPLTLPLAGVHGAERRDSLGQVHRITLPTGMLQALKERLTIAMSVFPGSKLESKGIAFALHYRQVPEYQQDILILAESLCRAYPQLMLQPGKCVVELKPHGVDKGTAIGAFMQEHPFSGRIPVFIGDDLTDEAGFHQVNTLNGLSIKVGPGETAAHFRLNNVAAVHQWLKQQQHRCTSNIGKEKGL
ncbi:trehalose-phosphatase [Brenneria uluponensis]|uniref:trehalose-phosphatase n=1 Tax=Brenneria uluponensis TaxID=3057057 RepID=UPI0028E1B79B|nr:trehalose-phosphatase [Brenneria ulupoensis]